MPSMQGTSHLALTVTDPRASIEWYEKVFGGARVPMTDEPGHLVIGLLTPDGFFIGLQGHGATPTGDRFSEFRVGLDHVAFGVADRDVLEKWTRRLDELGIEHGEIEEAHYGSDVSFRDPDGIALEFFAPPAA